jgi:two-component system, cell cycle sensor histidine kinase and response regulator CckA
MDETRPPAHPRQTARILALNVMVALGYIAAAAAGRLLAIPPGYASAFWVPAGIAFMAVLAGGMRLAPGVALGSFAHNLIVSIDVVGAAAWLSILPANIAIALGATAQALVGARLVRRYVDYPSKLVRAGDAVRLLVLGGPVACLVSASVGVLTLVAVGVIPAGTRAFSWFNWWVGDAIGVLLVVPLWLVAFGEPRSFWRHRWRTVAAPIVLMVLIALGAFHLAQRQENARIGSEFAARSDELARRLQNGLDENLTILEALRGHFVASEHSDRAAFATLTRDVLAHHPSLRAVGWAPWIAASERAAFERAARADGAPGYAIQMFAGEERVPRGPDTSYVPLLYVEPRIANQALLGLDLASEPRHRAAAEQAMRSGSAALSAPLALLGDANDTGSFLVLLPVEDPGQAAGMPPRGFVVGVTGLRTFLGATLTGADLAGVSFRIVDATNSEAPAIVAERRQSATGAAIDEETTAASLKDYAQQRELRAPGRVWRLELHPTLSFVNQARTALPWFVQTAGLGFAGIIGILLLNLSGRNEEVVREVAVRTRELSERNQELTHEIAKRERAQAELVKSEQRFRTIIDGAPLMCAIARDGKHLYANPRYLHQHGYERMEEVIGTPIADHVAPSHRADFTARAQRRRQGLPAERIYESMALRRDGSEFPVVAYVDIIELADGPAVIGFFEDLTERQAMEAARRESDERFAAAFEYSANGMVIEDREGRIIRVNPALCHLLGYRLEELLGRDLYELTHPDDLLASAESARGLWDGRVQSYQLEKRYLHKSGRAVWVLIAAALSRDEAQRPVHLVVQVQDLTQRKQLEAQLGQAQRLESLGRLAGGIAHDFNNLLTVINGRGAILLRTLSEADERRGQLKALLRAGQHAADLTRQLLAFGRQQLWRPAPVGLNGFLRESERLLQSLVREDIVLELRADCASDDVLADPTQLHQVLVNLVVNAVDAMAHGGRLRVATANVTVDATEGPDETPGEFVVLAVSDSGPGIDPALQRRIFEPFFTTKAIGKGTGLGLATVYGIVRQAGGFIRLESGSAGTTFRVYLPRSALAAAPPEEDTVRLAGIPCGGETVLVVEDQEEVRELAIETVRSLGYRVLGAEDGAAAVALSERTAERIDILLTDVVMPGMNGRELAERLKEQRPALRVLFVSGYSSEVISHRGILDAGVDYLAKPYTAEALAAKLREVLDAPAAAA